MINIDQNIDFNSSPQGDDNKEPAVWLSIQNTKDRKLFKKFFPNFRTVESTAKNIKNQEFDLCIVDEQSFQRQKKDLQTFKKQEAPVFLPVMLLSKSQDKARKSSSVSELVDDVVYIPASTKLLQSRINMLLQQRKYSQKLEEKNRQLEKKNQQLAEEKEFRDAIIESLPGVFFMLDEDFNFINWNSNLNRISEYNDDEIEQMKATDFFLQKEHDKIRTSLTKILNKGVSDIEVKFQSKSGKLIPHLLIGRKLEKSNKTYVVSTGVDISKRLGIEQKLRKSEQRWANLVKNDPNLIQILDSNGVIQFINQAGATILGFDSPGSILGENYFDLIEIDEEEKRLMKHRINDVLNGNEIDTHIFKIKNSSGNPLYLESMAVSIELNDGSIGFQQVAQDVTDRMEYERKIESSLKEKKTLLQEIHHRVKNNLAVVSGMMELQTFNIENEEVVKKLMDSKNRIKTMALIHEKLYQSKSLSQIDFASYTADLINNIKRVSTYTDDIEVKFDYDSFHLNVNQAVPCALIINEVLANAYEHAFTDRDHGIIRISIKKTGDIITVKIEDNGKGLPDDVDSRKKGSMGMTIVKTLIKQLQADSKIENKNGLSFTFSFERQEYKGSSNTLI